VYVHNGFAISSKPNLSFYERSGKNPIIFVRYERTHWFWSRVVDFF